jgi:hypothetical protein
MQDVACKLLAALQAEGYGNNVTIAGNSTIRQESEDSILLGLEFEPANSPLVLTTTEVQPAKQVTSSPDVVASSVREPATSPLAEHPPSPPPIPPVAASNSPAQEAPSAKIQPAIPMNRNNSGTKPTTSSNTIALS